MSRISKIFCILVMIGLLDIHLVFMQAWAWVSMLNDRIPSQGIEQAIDTTFSGEFPCEKCLALKEIKTREAEDGSGSSKVPSSSLEQQIKIVGAFSALIAIKVYSPKCARLPFVATH